MKNSRKIIAIAIAAALLCTSYFSLATVSADVEISNVYQITYAADGSVTDNGVSKQASDVFALRAHGLAGAVEDLDYAANVTVADGRTQLPIREKALHGSNNTISNVENRGKEYIWSVKDLDARLAAGDRVESVSIMVEQPLLSLNRRNGVVFPLYYDSVNDRYVCIYANNEWTPRVERLVITPGYEIHTGNADFCTDVQAGAHNGYTKDMWNSGVATHVVFTANYHYNADNTLNKIEGTFASYDNENLMDSVAFDYAANGAADSKTIEGSVFTTLGSAAQEAVKPTVIDAKGCKPGILTGTIQDAAQFSTFELTMKKSDETFLDEVIDVLEEQIAAFESGEPSLAKADAVFQYYNMLSETSRTQVADKMAPVFSYIKAQYADENGNFVFEPASRAAYPQLSEYIWPLAGVSDTANTRTNPAFMNAAGVNAMTVVVDKSKIVAGSTVMNMFSNMNQGDTSLQEEVTNLGFKFEQPGDCAGILGLTHTPGDIVREERASSANHVIWKTENSEFYHTNWLTNTAIQDYAAGELTAKYDAAQYIAFRYVVELQDAAPDERLAEGAEPTHKNRKHTDIGFTVSSWFDDGDGVYEAGEYVYCERSYPLGRLNVIFDNDTARTFQYGVPQSALDSGLITKLICEAPMRAYEELYTAPDAAALDTAEVLVMYNDYISLYHGFTDYAKERVEGIVTACGLRPTANGSSIRVNLDQNIAFYAIRPSADLSGTDVYASGFGVLFITNHSLEENTITDTIGGLTVRSAAALNLKKSYAKGEPLDPELQFVLTGTDVSGSENWGKYIVAKFYVEYKVGDQSVYVYSTGKDRLTTDAYASDMDGVCIRAVSQIISEIAKDLYANKDCLADNVGAAGSDYEGVTLAEAYADAGFNNSAFLPTPIETLSFLIAYKDSVGQLQQ